MAHDIAESAGQVAPLDVAEVLDGLDVWLQPIINVATGDTFATEALARFGHAPHRSSDDVIAEAHASGYGYVLEAACLKAALALRETLPDGVALSVNVSPDVMHHPTIARTWPEDLRGVIIEVTEHDATSPAAFRDQVAHLRLRGAAISVDDVSTGYAGLLRLATLRPEYVKIDRKVVSGVRDSRAQAAVLDALVTLSHRLGAAVIGEGVESLDDLVALAEADVDYGQGWAIGRPAVRLAPVNQLVVQTCQAARRQLLARPASPGRAAARTHDMHAVTAALSGASHLADVHAAVAGAATELEVDVIGVSVLDGDQYLREITSGGQAIDTTRYRLSDYPATEATLRTGNTTEVHLEDPASDPAEKTVLRRFGYASVLLVPIGIGSDPVGVLEFAHRTHRRWTTDDIAQARGLATHLGNALQRVGA